MGGGVAAADVDVAVDGLDDGGLGYSPISLEAAVGPFDAAIAEFNVGLSKDHETPFEAAHAGDVFEVLACVRVELLVDADDDVWRFEKLTKATGGERRNFREWFLCDEL